MSAARARTRSVTRPSISPMTNVPRFPRSTTPGSITSAPKFTNASTTRSPPSASVSTAAFSPFCKDTT